MARTEIGIVLEEDVALGSAEVELVHRERINTSIRAILGDGHQPELRRVRGKRGGLEHGALSGPGSAGTGGNRCLPQRTLHCGRVVRSLGMGRWEG
jgi:hypothetical protein